MFILLYSAAFLTQTICLDDTVVKFEIWDTAGQERYHSLAPMYYRGAQAAIVMYDITNKVIHSLISWLRYFFDSCLYITIWDRAADIHSSSRKCTTIPWTAHTSTVRSFLADNLFVLQAPIVFWCHLSSNQPSVAVLSWLLAQRSGTPCRWM